MVVLRLKVNAQAAERRYFALERVKTGIIAIRITKEAGYPGNRYPASLLSITHSGQLCNGGVKRIIKITRMPLARLQLRLSNGKGGKIFKLVRKK